MQNHKGWNVQFCLGLHEFESMNDPEIVNFRKKTRKLCEDDARVREKKVKHQSCIYVINISIHVK